MQKFYFHIRSDHVTLEDQEGEYFLDLASAHADAVEAIREILAEKIKAGEILNGQEIQIFDSMGNLLEDITFRSVFITLI